MTMLDAIGRSLAAACAEGGKISPARLTAQQYPAFGYARLLAMHAAARAIADYAERHGDFERRLAQCFAADYRMELQAFAALHPAFCHPEAISFPSTQEDLLALGREILARDRDLAGASGLAPEHAEIRCMFASFADEQVAPLAETTHRDDRLIPESLLRAYAELGVFGVSIPQEFGGSFADHLTMVLASEELSRASLGIGGSVVTRPEIAAKAILAGGTPEQQAAWLPLLARGKKMVCVAVTEPGAGSDVAHLQCVAKPTSGGVLLNGEKTWCTFAGRSDVLLVLARTGTKEDGHKGLTLFLAEKPVSDDEYAFRFVQASGGVIEGKAIRTIGYRGMHSFAVSFQDYFVPSSHQIGRTGQGFYLQMQGFAGGRIQTAARALGVMEAAFRAAVRYVKERRLFGRTLAEFPLTQVRLAQMAARLQACRQLTYATCALMDKEGGGVEAALVKFLACREAEWVTREAMQLHGGMGYAEEYPVSRYWQDARVLSLFEGAEEVLGVMVIARSALEKYCQ
ncbi:MAG: acyl-CoA dehydrogenase family protein [Deltaproteobacteria bacterium]|nr:acyl-CoA dehydrogenase family protein [Deltaproteobacteria bacterium]